MALDPSIFGMANRPTVALENPMDIAMKRMAMQNQQMQMEQQRQAMQDAADFRQQTGVSPGMAKHQQEIATADFKRREAQASFEKSMREMTKEQRAQAHADMTEFVRVAYPLTQAKTPEEFQQGVQAAVKQFDPDGSKGWAKMAPGLTPDTLKQLADATMEHGKWLEKTFPKDVKPGATHQNEKRELFTLGPGNTPQYVMEGDKRVKAPAPSSMTLNMGGGGLSPEAEAMLVDKYRKTGQLDGDVGRNMVLRTKIINAAAAADKAEGNTTDLAQNKQTYAADKESLKKIQANRDMLVSFESTALKNLGVFEAAAKKVIDSGSPLLNKPLRAFAGAAAGSPEQAVYTAARQIVIPEFAKINSGSLNGVLSDSARHEVAALIPENATLGQIMATANLLKTDAHNRRTSMDDMIKEIKGRGKGGGESKPYAGRSLSKDAIAKIATQKGMTYAQAEKQFTDGGGVVK